MLLKSNELEILRCLIESWVKNGSPLPGEICYADVFNLLNKLGAKELCP